MLRRCGKVLNKVIKNEEGLNFFFDSYLVESMWRSELNGHDHFNEMP